MRLPSVPGPSDVFHAVEGLREGFGEALALVPRMGSVVGGAESLLDRVSRLLTRVEDLVDRADEQIAGIAVTRAKADAAIEAVGATQRKADEAIAAVGTTNRKADDAITAVGTMQQKADAVIGAAGATASRADAVFDDFEPTLSALAPSVRRLEATLDPSEVEAMVTLIDRLPVLVTHLDRDILPILASLDGVGTDVHDLLDTVQDMRQVVKGFPGSRLFRRRGAEEIAQQEAEEEETAGEVEETTD
ncbi:MAG: hypothetical protein ACXVFZ_12910 [Blastococcus sp.]